MLLDSLLPSLSGSEWFVMAVLILLKTAAWTSGLMALVPMYVDLDVRKRKAKIKFDRRLRGEARPALESQNFEEFMKNSEAPPAPPPKRYTRLGRRSDGSVVYQFIVKR